MNKSINITIIGAGSAQFSAGIVRDICVTKGLRGSHVTLMDIDEIRLKNVLKLAQRLAEELKANISFSCVTDRIEALKGADFVINTAQVGGHEWQNEQVRMGQRHGYEAGRNTLDIQNATQMVFFLQVAMDMEKYCPEAWLIQSANPVFEGCTLITRKTKIKTIGLCHGHFGYREIAEVLELDLKYVTAQMQGFNHYIWMTDFRYKGENAYPLIDKWIETEAEEYWNNTERTYSDNQMSRAAIHQYKMFGYMPIGDTPRFGAWWYNTDTETKKRWFGALGGFDSELGWSKYLEDLNKKLQEVENAANDYSTPITKTFEMKQSDEQIVPIINSLVNDVEGVYQVNIPNTRHLIKGFPEDLVVEVQGVINASGVRGISVPQYPKKLMCQALIPRWGRAETLIEAVASKDIDILISVMLNDQRTKSFSQAENFIKEWLESPYNKYYKHYLSGKLGI